MHLQDLRQQTSSSSTTHAITHSSAIEFAAMNFDIRIAGLIRARLFMPLAAFGLGWPFSAWAGRFRPGLAAFGLRLAWPLPAPRLGFGLV